MLYLALKISIHVVKHRYTKFEGEVLNVTHHC